MAYEIKISGNSCYVTLDEKINYFHREEMGHFPQEIEACSGDIKTFIFDFSGVKKISEDGLSSLIHAIFIARTRRNAQVTIIRPKIRHFYRRLESIGLIEKKKNLTKTLLDFQYLSLRRS